jgi:hypothetical protein
MYNRKNQAILQMFSADSQFGLISTQDNSEQQMTTIEALSLMDNQGVTQIWLDDLSLSLDGASFELFYCTFKGNFTFQS